MFLNCQNSLKKIKQGASNVWRFFLDLIFPIECLGCGREGRWLCDGCFNKINLKIRQYCLHCKKENNFGQFCSPPARPQPDKVILAGNGRSGGCQIIYNLDGVWIAALYDELLISRAIKRLKYHFISGIAADLSKLIILSVNGLLRQNRILKSGLDFGVDWLNFKRAANLPLVILNFNDSLVMPVPLSRKRLRWRGFNQAEILAEIFSKKYGLEINVSDLVRVKHKTAQAKLNEIKRLENIKNCFVWQGGNLNKRNIILIDDVVTTGATLNECAKILKANGAGEVWGLVVAKG